MKKKPFIIIILAALITVSGCVGKEEPKINRKQGIIISEFSAEPTTVSENDYVDIALSIENVGGTTSNCVNAVLEGAEGNWRDEEGNIIKALEKGGWDLTVGMDGIELTGRFKGLDISIGRGPTEWYGKIEKDGGTLTEFDTSREGSFFDNFNFMWDKAMKTILCGDVSGDVPLQKWGSIALKPPRQGMPGDFRTTSWRLRPPDVPEGTSTSFPITARVNFNYKTTGTITLPVYSDKEFERMNNLGKTPQKLQVEKSDAPVQLNVLQANTPIVVDTTEYELSDGRLDKEIVPIKMEFENVGEGYPIGAGGPKLIIHPEKINWKDIFGGVTDNGIDWGSIWDTIKDTKLEEIEDTVDEVIDIEQNRENGVLFGKMTISGPPGIQFKRCLKQNNVPTIPIDRIHDNQIQLRGSGKAPFSCTLKLNREEWIGRTSGIITIEYEMEYIYYTIKTVSVEVEGQRDY